MKPPLNARPGTGKLRRQSAATWLVYIPSFIASQELLLRFGAYLAS
jgi:hypothetical protein